MHPLFHLEPLDVRIKRLDRAAFNHCEYFRITLNAKDFHELMEFGVKTCALPRKIAVRTIYKAAERYDMDIDRQSLKIWVWNQAQKKAQKKARES